MVAKLDRFARTLVGALAVLEEFEQHNATLVSVADNIDLSTPVGNADICHFQEWTGHANVQTTLRYRHYAPRPEDAKLAAEAFGVAPWLQLDDRPAGGRTVAFKSCLPD